MIQALFETQDLANRARSAILARGVTADDVAVRTSEPAVGKGPDSRALELVLWIVMAPVASIFVLTVNGVGYALALLAIAVAIAVRPLDEEHWLQVRDEVCGSGGAVLEINHTRYREQNLIRALRQAGAIDIQQRMDEI